MLADPDGRLVALGDIHGCADALEVLLAAVQPRQNDTLVVLGDFIDQGRDTCGVIDLLIEWSNKCNLIWLMGNHEEMLINALQNETARRYWEQAGGMSTIYSYRFGGVLADVPADHLEFIQASHAYFECEDFIFVHANFDPRLAMSQQPVHLLRWAILDPDEVQWHVSGKTVFCGHTEQPESEVLHLGCVVCIDTACWHYGWLTAVDVRSGSVWQSSRFGVLRESGDIPIGPWSPRE